MDFDGIVYFDFACPYVWEFWRLLAAAEGRGARLSVEWRPFSLEARNDDSDRPPVWETPERSRGDLHALAAYEWVRGNAPEQTAPFLGAVLRARHEDRRKLGDWEMLAAAAAVSGIDGSALVGAVRDRGEGYDRVAASHEEAIGFEVIGTPTLFRWGPPMLVAVLPVAGDPLERLRVIDAMLRDDGLWSLQKP
jgi:2-hydroxychromene-2-carboxylate isomerase